MKKEKIILPDNCAMIGQDEMRYIDGGKAITICTRVGYLSKDACIAKAKALKKDGYCTKMTITQIAQEIHAHAVYGYGSIPVGYIAKKTDHPLVAKAIVTIGKKGLNGISLGDKCDKWYRVMAYALVW